MLTSVVTQPTVEPLTLAEAKDHLRILHDTEDDLISAYALAARQHIEETTGCALIHRTLDAWFGGWPSRGVIDLPWAPLSSVTGVYYRDADDVEQTLAADQYEVVVEGFIGRIERRSGVTWPALLSSSKAVRVRYVAGYGTASSSVPEPLRQALRLMVSHFYYRRDATSEVRAEVVPMAVGCLCEPYKRFGWV